jgi:hypothetical protein
MGWFGGSSSDSSAEKNFTSGDEDGFSSAASLGAQHEPLTAVPGAGAASLQEFAQGMQQRMAVNQVSRGEPREGNPGRGIQRGEPAKGNPEMGARAKRKRSEAGKRSSAWSLARPGHGRAKVRVRAKVWAKSKVTHLVRLGLGRARDPGQGSKQLGPSEVPSPAPPHHFI